MVLEVAATRLNLKSTLVKILNLKTTSLTF